MQLTEAAGMLANNNFNLLQKEKWADLGCGNGTFTLALATLLAPQSIIYAVDTDRSALDQLPAKYNSIVIDKVPGNFETDDLSLKQLDGILMANSLHYVKNKNSFIQKAVNWLEKEGCFLLVEYDTDIPNKWVPYPINFSSLGELFNTYGFYSIRKLMERPSVFGRANMYSAIVQK